MKYEFNRSMLPAAGTKWVPFDTLVECAAFMAWAEKETESHRHPCEAYYIGIEIWDEKPKHIAKVKN